MRVCPHCKRDIDVRAQKVNVWGGEVRYFVKCFNYQCEKLAHHATEEEAIAAWNLEAHYIYERKEIENSV